MGSAEVGPSIKPRFSPDGKLRVCGSRTPSVSWISSLYSSTLSLSYSVCSVFTPLPRVRSISLRSLELSENDAQHTVLIDAPFEILEYTLNGFVEIIHIIPLNCTLRRHAYVETRFGKLHGIFVTNHLVLGGSPMRIYRWDKDENYSPG